MLNRREIIASSVVLTLTAPGAAARLTGGALPSTAASPSAALPSAEGLHVPHFVAASGLAEARDAAARAAAQGARIVWIGRDLTPAYSWLDLALRTQPFAVTGVTSAHDFFVLERLAWDRGLYTVSRRALGSGPDSATLPDTKRTAVIEWRLEPRMRR